MHQLRFHFPLTGGSLQVGKEEGDASGRQLATC